MKKFFISCILFIASMATFAVPAKRDSQTITQPDGSVIEVVCHGDEFFRYTTTLDGYAVMLNANGLYEYAEVGNNNCLRCTGVKAHNKAERSEQERSMLQTIDPSSQLNKLRALQQQNSERALTRAKVKSPKAVSSIPTKGLIILVNFSDIKFGATNNNAFFTNMMNQEGFTANGGPGSVRDYFRAASGGNYNPEFRVVGPYTVSQTASYYASNNGAIPSTSDDYGMYKAGVMVNEACSLAYADGVRFDDYDIDGDKEADFVYVIYAGHNSAEHAPNTIWPHAYYVSQYVRNASQRTYGGITIDHYACSSELRGKTGSSVAGIATFCHEFSHILGLPDYYDTNYGSNYNNNLTPGSWTLMDNGSYNNDGLTPPTYSAHDRYFLGWLTPQIMNAAENVTLQNLETSNTARVVTSNGVLPSATSTSVAYYFENRQNSGWDEYLPGHGMIVTKVKYNATAWAQNGPNNGSTMYYDIIEADGKPSGGDAGDPFPGTSNKRSYSPFTTYPLTEITETNGNVQFKFMGGVDCSGYTVYFSGDNCTSSNTDDCIAENETYVTKLSPAAGYTLTIDDVLVSMGGNDLTAPTYFTYENDTLKIPNVTGNIEIVAIAQSTGGTIVSGGDVYRKVTSAPGDWSGDYLLVYEAGSCVLDGSRTAMDAIDNNKSVTISNNTIEAEPNQAYQVTIAASGTKYTIQTASGYYIGNTSNSNGLASSKTTSYDNTISLDGNGVNIVSGGSYLRYNASTGQNRFRYYKSSSYAAQQPVALYKRETGNTTPIAVAQEDELKLISLEGGVQLHNVAVGATITIYNLAGQICQQTTCSTTSPAFTLKSGIYMLQVTTDRATNTFKTIVK